MFLTGTYLKQSFLYATRLLFNQDVILLGGDSRIDTWRPSERERKECFFVHLNHHLHRRKNYQPCDWLIARQGSTMKAPSFLTLPESSKSRVKLISVQLNHDFLLQQWANLNIPIFPFYENRSLCVNSYHPTLEWCNQFWNEIGTNPFIGILAIRMILLFPVRSLTLKGFTFFKNDGAPLAKNVSCHNVTKQIQWLIHLYHTDFRLQINENLKTILQINERGYTRTFDVENS